ncbi:ubiquinol-cytochrome c reductase cytochrome b subunit, partial [Streptomyces sp. NPDC048277]
GVVKRLPHGEFVEMHEPLSQEELHLLTQHEQYRPIGSIPGVDGTTDAPDVSAPDAGAHLTRRLRVRLSRGFYGEDTQIAKPTTQEYREIAGEHTH